MPYAVTYCTVPALRLTVYRMQKLTVLYRLLD